GDPAVVDDEAAVVHVPAVVGEVLVDPSSQVVPGTGDSLLRADHDDPVTDLEPLAGLDDPGGALPGEVGQPQLALAEARDVGQQRGPLHLHGDVDQPLPGDRVGVAQGRPGPGQEGGHQQDGDDDAHRVGQR